MSNNIEEDIKTVEEILKDFNCEEISFTMLFKERANAISNVLNEFKRIRSLDIHKLIEDAETGQLIHKDKVKGKIEKLNDQARIQKNPTILTIIEREKLVLTNLLEDK